MAIQVEGGRLFRAKYPPPNRLRRWLPGADLDPGRFIGTATADLDGMKRNTIRGCCGATGCDRRNAVLPRNRYAATAPLAQPEALALTNIVTGWARAFRSSRPAAYPASAISRKCRSR